MLMTTSKAMTKSLFVKICFFFKDLRSKLFLKAMNIAHMEVDNLSHNPYLGNPEKRNKNLSLKNQTPRT